MTKTVLILGITSDIGRELAARFERDSWSVVGTHRPEPTPRYQGCTLDPVELRSSRKGASMRRHPAATTCGSNGTSWCGRWHRGAHWPVRRSRRDAWESGFSVNALAPLRFLRAVYDLRNRAGNARCRHVLRQRNQWRRTLVSAYCASKIVLIKMCELLDAESADTASYHRPESCAPRSTGRHSTPRPEAGTTIAR